MIMTKRVRIYTNIKGFSFISVITDYIINITYDTL